MNIIFGAGGVAREISWLLTEADPLFKTDFFVIGDNDSVNVKTFDGVRVISDKNFDASVAGPISAYIAVGMPKLRKTLYERIGLRPETAFPTFVHASASLDRRPDRTKLGSGVIVYPMASMTTDVSLSDFVQLNPCASVGHGACIGSYTTICPGVNISGEVVIGDGCFIGAGAVIKEGVRIADNCIVGAGAVVIRDILDAGSWAGVPAKKIPS